MSACCSEMEELNKQKLDDLRNGLGDLKIVDVRRKPRGWATACECSSRQAAPRSAGCACTELGFYPDAASDETLDIYGANGEVVIDTKDGVEYVCAFGDIAPQAAATSTRQESGPRTNGKR